MRGSSVSGKASAHENSTFHFHTSRADAQMRGFFVCSLLVFLSHGVCKSPYISIHRALQQRYCHEMWPCGTASMYAICKHVCRTSGPHFVVQWSFLLLPLPTCLHRGDDDMFAAAWRVSVQRQHGKSQIHGGASKAAVWFRPSGAQACLQHAHVDRSDCCLEVAKQLAIIVTISGRHRDACTCFQLNFAADGRFELM